MYKEFEIIKLMDMVTTRLCSWSPLAPPKLSQNLKRLKGFYNCSSNIHEETLSLIHNSGVIACLRANNAEIAFEAASAALRGGISVLEIVVSTPGVFQVLQQLVQDHPAAALGAGTVLSPENALDAMNVGAKFLMSPAMVKGIMDVVQHGEVVYVPGAMTPTEILSAYDAGAKIVKVYPVSALGGAKYISALNKPFAHIPMVASQGIMIDSVDEYICCGASSVVLSDAIFNKEAMAQKNFNAIYELACLASARSRKAVARKRNQASN